jgi:hypothetical protein
MRLTGRPYEPQNPKHGSHDDKNGQKTGNLVFKRRHSRLSTAKLVSRRTKSASRI